MTSLVVEGLMVGGSHKFPISVVQNCNGQALNSCQPLFAASRSTPETFHRILPTVSHDVTQYHSCHLRADYLEPTLYNIFTIWIIALQYGCWYYTSISKAISTPPRLMISLIPPPLLGITFPFQLFLISYTCMHYQPSQTACLMQK